MCACPPGEVWRETGDSFSLKSGLAAANHLICRYQRADGAGLRDTRDDREHRIQYVMLKKALVGIKLKEDTEKGTRPVMLILTSMTFTILHCLFLNYTCRYLILDSSSWDVHLRFCRDHWFRRKLLVLFRKQMPHGTLAQTLTLMTRFN